MNFLYILPGWEGTAHDGRVINDAYSKNFTIPSGKYYLGDAGYANSATVLTPYRATRYHLREQALANARPQTPQELFNLRHASLRNVVERTFGLWKLRFRILSRGRRNLPLISQVKLVYALAAVHNFINKFEPDDLAANIPIEGDDITNEDLQRAERQSEVGMNTRRDNMAQAMWRQYNEYNNSR